MSGSTGAHPAVDGIIRSKPVLHDQGAHKDMVRRRPFVCRVRSIRHFYKPSLYIPPRNGTASMPPFALDGTVANAVRKRPLLRKMCRAALLSPNYCAAPIRSFWNGASDRVTYRLRYNIAYTRDYYVAHADMPECQSWHRNIIRPADMGAAICYALGAASWEEVCRIQGCDDSVSLPPRGETTAAEQSRIIGGAGLGRNPGLVYDMGCGRGEVAATLVYMGISAVAVDPSHAAGALVDETARRFYGLPAASVPFERGTALGALCRSSQTPDTVIFCESVEHMPLSELFATFEWIRDHADGARGGGGVLAVVTNWPNYHPIRAPPGDWNHVHDVDDELYDRLASLSRKTVARHGSHLVLQF